MKASQTSKALIIVVGLLVLVASLNVIVRRAGPIRWDTTSGDVFTLTEGTLNILKRAQESERPVTIRFYLSDEEDAQLPKELVEYSKRVKDLLAEYAKASGNSVVVQTYSPVPNSVEEDAAELDGIMRRDPRADLPPPDSYDEYDFNLRGRAREPYYFGLSVSSLENVETIPYLDPRQETELEYQLSRAVSAVIRKKKLKIGLLEGSDIQLAGQAGMMGRPSPPWTIYNYLQRDFEIVSVPFDVQPMKPGDKDHPFFDIDLLLIVHPVKVNRPQPMQPGMPAMGATTLEPLSKESQYAIDQYLVGGGKVLAFLDNQYFVSRFFDVYSTTLPFPLDDRHPKWYKDLVNLFESSGWSHYRSGLEELYPAWGIKLGRPGSGDPVIYDPKYTRAVSYDRPVNSMVQSEFRLINQLRQIPNEGVYQQIVNSLGRGRALMSDFGKDALAKDHPVTRGLNSVRMVDAGPIEGQPAAGLEMRTLVRSSGKSKAIPAEAEGLILDRSRTLDQAMANLQEADVTAEHHPVAVLLEGNFRSAFEKDPTKVEEEEETPPESAPAVTPPSVTPPVSPVRPPLLPAGAPDSLPEATPAENENPEESADPAPAPGGEPEEAADPAPTQDDPPTEESADPAAPGEEAAPEPESAEPAEGEFPNPQNPEAQDPAENSEAAPAGETAAEDNPATEQPGEEQPAETEEAPGEEKPAADEPAADEPTADEPAADEPAADEPVADEPAADKPAADQPGEEGAKKEPADSADPSDASKDEEEKEEEQEPDHHVLKGTKPGALAIVSDVDMLFDFFLGNPEAGARRDHDNIAFVLNLVETMAGDQELVNIRGRDSTSRGFTVINDIRERAAERAAEPRKKIRKKREEIEKQTMDGKLVLTQEGIQYQIDEAKAKKIRQLEREGRDLKREENKIDREQRREVEAAISRYEWINMLLTPVIVIILGLVVALARAFKTAAR